MAMASTVVTLRRSNGQKMADQCSTEGYRQRVSKYRATEWWERSKKADREALQEPRREWHGDLNDACGLSLIEHGC